MNVLDEVLQVEKDTAAKVAAANEAAATQIADAKKAQADAVEAEKARLAELESDTLTKHELTIQKNSEEIIAAASHDVAAIKAAFANKASVLTKKIAEALS